MFVEKEPQCLNSDAGPGAVNQGGIFLSRDLHFLHEAKKFHLSPDVFPTFLEKQQCHAFPKESDYPVQNSHGTPIPVVSLTLRQLLFTR